MGSPRGLPQNLERVFHSVRALALQSGPVRLSDEYRALIEACERLPANRAGSDKTWVADADRSYQAHYQHARRRG